MQTLNQTLDLHKWVRRQLWRYSYNGEKCIKNRLVDMFHSEMDIVSKNQIIDEFTKPTSSIRLIIATSAFGMGIDIPDVGAVLVPGMPKTSLSLWQLFGRAGRDGGRQCWQNIMHTRVP
jgi:superfamily II DNA helicase RecQ